MAKNKKTPFATDNKGEELYVDADWCGIHAMVLVCDGVTLVQFGDEKRFYIKLTDVIEWHQKELKVSRGSSGNKKLAEQFSKVLADFKAGTLEINEPV